MIDWKDWKECNLHVLPFGTKRCAMKSVDRTDTRIKKRKKSSSANTNNPCLFMEP